MSNYTKKKNAFVAMVVAIVLVVAAIAYVVYDEVSSISKIFDNKDFSFAVSEMLGKAPAFVKQEDLDKIEYLELNYDEASKTAFIALGDAEFVKLYNDYTAAAEAGEDTSKFDIEDKFMSAVFEYDAKSGDLLDDIKLFKNLDVISAAGVAFTDSSVFTGMTGLKEAYVANCGLTEVNGFANLDAENLKSLNLAGNDISDWSPLDYIKSKVIVKSYYTFIPTEDGTISFEDMTLEEQTLEEYYKELAEQEEKEAEEAESSESEENTEAAE